MSRSWLRRCVVTVAVLIMTSCQVDVTIDLFVAEDGSGTVAVDATFDPEAGTTLLEEIRLADLERAGWTIARTNGEDGSGSITATKTVVDATQWQAVLDELAGPGVFNDVGLIADSEFANTSQRLELSVDLRDGWALFDDDGITEALGTPFGAPIESLTDGRSLDDLVSVRVNATVVSDAAGTPSAGSYTPRFDDDDPLEVRIGSTTEDSTAILLRWISIALFSLFVLATVLAVTGIVLQRRSDRLRPAPTPASLSTRVPGASAVVAGASASPIPPEDPVRLVVIEPLAVLYGQATRVEDVVLPFVRDHGATARADTIVDGYQSVLVGSMTPAAFWELCGVTGDQRELDRAYVELRKLRGGAGDFFKELQRRRIPVAAVTNDSSAWSSATRERDRLRVVWPWLISAEVGATTDNVGIFEVLRRETGTAHRHCLYVDSNLAGLDAARDLGMRTALFDHPDLDLPAVVGHAVVSDYRQLFSTRR